LEGKRNLRHQGLDGLGWYENDLNPRNNLITNNCLNPEDLILDVGVIPLPLTRLVQV
jgi:hypothetical protein